LGRYPHRWVRRIAGVLASPRLRPQTRKAIFLAETSIRAALYASREWAGGETARALRYAFKDLRSYLTSEDVDREHYARQEDVCIDLLTREGLPSPVIRVNLAWLREAVARLASLEVRCQGLLEAYTHGVIYAIRLTPDRLTGVIRPGGGMGIRVFRRISQTEIVGKVRLTDEECGRVYALRPAVDQRRCDLDLFGAPGSLLASLREKAPGSDPLVPSSGAYVMARDADRDPAAGEDDALQVAHKHGTSEMIEYLKNNPTARTW